MMTINSSFFRTLFPSAALGANLASGAIPLSSTLPTAGLEGFENVFDPREAAKGLAMLISGMRGETGRVEVTKGDGCVTSPEPGKCPNDGPKIDRFLSLLCAKAYKPWVLPAETEENIKRIFDDGKIPVKERINTAAYELAMARLASIGKENLSPSNYKDLKSYFFEDMCIEGIRIESSQDVEKALIEYVFKYTGERVAESSTGREFRKLLKHSSVKGFRSEMIFKKYKILKEFQTGHLGGYLPFYNAIFIHPLSGETMTVGMCSAMVKMHEFDHMTIDKDRFDNRVILATIMWLIKYWNPFSPVTETLGTIYDESHAFGAMWELMRRVPKEIRDQIMDEIVKDMERFGFDTEVIKNGESDIVRKKIGRTFYTITGRYEAFLKYCTFKCAQLAEGDKREAIRALLLATGGKYRTKVGAIVLKNALTPQYLYKLAAYAILLSTIL